MSRTCEHIEFPQGEPMRECGEPAAWQYHYDFPSFTDHRGRPCARRVGSTVLCDRHGRSHREDPVNPNNEIPLHEQWTSIK